MAQLDVLKYDNLIIGGDIVTEEIIIAASQTIKRGDVLIKADGKYSRPAGAVEDISLDTTIVEGNVTEAELVPSNIVRIATEDVTTGVGETSTSIGYVNGIFNEYSMRFGGSSTADDNRDVLASKSIYIKKSQKQ